MVGRRTVIGIATLAVALTLAAPSLGAMGDPNVAALQVALARKGLYGDTIDGLAGPLTRTALTLFQRDAGLKQTGRAGAATVAALGGPARRLFGARALAFGKRGWDVVGLQFALAWHGFPSGVFDGVYGRRVEDAVRRFQQWAGLGADGVAGPATFDALRAPPASVAAGFAHPLPGAPLGDLFGPRGNRFHTGVDFPADEGVPVLAAGGGTVSFAGFDTGGYGNLVVVEHGNGVSTYYAHLSRIDVAAGQAVSAGAVVGLVGNTGHSFGPHLHFEVRLGGAPVDPLPSLGLG